MCSNYFKINIENYRRPEQVLHQLSVNKEFEIDNELDLLKRTEKNFKINLNKRENNINYSNSNLKNFVDKTQLYSIENINTGFNQCQYKHNHNNFENYNNKFKTESKILLPDWHEIKSENCKLRKMEYYMHQINSNEKVRNELFNNDSFNLSMSDAIDKYNNAYAINYDDFANQNEYSRDNKSYNIERYNDSDLNSSIEPLEAYDLVLPSNSFGSCKEPLNYRVSNYETNMSVNNFNIIDDNNRYIDNDNNINSNIKNYNNINNINNNINININNGYELNPLGLNNNDINSGYKTHHDKSLFDGILGYGEQQLINKDSMNQYYSSSEYSCSNSSMSELDYDACGNEFEINNKVENYNNLDLNETTIDEEENGFEGISEKKNNPILYIIEPRSSSCIKPEGFNDGIGYYKPLESQTISYLQDNNQEQRRKIKLKYEQDQELVYISDNSTGNIINTPDLTSSPYSIYSSSELSPSLSIGGNSTYELEDNNNNNNDKNLIGLPEISELSYFSNENNKIFKMINESKNNIESEPERKINGKITNANRKCKYCGKIFNRDLARHLRTHEPVGRFCCPFPKSKCSHKRGQFNRQYDFKKHLLHDHFKFDNPSVRRLHTLTEKLHHWGTCPCGEKFNGGDWLAKHILCKDGNKNMKNISLLTLTNNEENNDNNNDINNKNKKNDTRMSLYLKKASIRRTTLCPVLASYNEVEND